MLGKISLVFLILLFIQLTATTASRHANRQRRPFLPANQKFRKQTRARLIKCGGRNSCINVAKKSRILPKLTNGTHVPNQTSAYDSMASSVPKLQSTIGITKEIVTNVEDANSPKETTVASVPTEKPDGAQIATDAASGAQEISNQQDEISNPPSAATIFSEESTKNAPAVTTSISISSSGSNSSSGSKISSGSNISSATATSTSAISTAASNSIPTTAELASTITSTTTTTTPRTTTSPTTTTTSTLQPGAIFHCNMLKDVFQKNLSLFDADKKLIDARSMGSWKEACGSLFLFGKSAVNWDTNMKRCSQLGMRPIALEDNAKSLCVNKLIGIK